MATVLVITDTEILTLARLNLLSGADATLAAADVSAVKSYEQEAQEGRVEAAALSTPALQPLFRRAIAKIIAAELLEMRARDGSDEGFTGAGVMVAGPNPVTDYSRRLRTDGERELAPYLIAPPPGETDLSEIALREARAGDARSDAVLAQLKAGLVSAEEARTLLGLVGAPPAAGSLSPAELDARRRTVESLMSRGLLYGDEVGLAEYLGLPGGLSLTRQVVMPAVTPVTPSGASAAAQRRLFGRSEGARFGCAAGTGRGCSDDRY